MKKTWLSLLTVLIAAAALFLLALPASAADKSISLNKTEYKQNESILVTAMGEGNDWVGL